MATSKTNSDSLGFYLTGASASDVAQKSVIAALGNYRSSEEVQEIAFLADEVDQIPQVVIERIIGKSGEGTANINTAGASALTFTAPGGTEGASVTIADAGNALLEDAATGLAVRVSRDGSDTFPVGNPMPLTFAKPWHNLIGMDDVSNAERAAGLDTYLGGMLYAHGAYQLTLVKAYIKTLGTRRTTDSAQLGGSGTGTITTTGSFADWPDTGWARIEQSGGTLREIVYYTSRTATTLTISVAGHRARLGTSAGAGASNDVVDAVPGIRIASETPSSGAIQTIADEATSPTGRTWSTAITAAGGINIGTMAAATEIGLWIHREIPAAAVSSPQLENAIEFSWTEQTVAYTNPVSGFYKMADTTLATYLLWLGQDADPDFTAAVDDSGSSLPLTTALTPPGGGTLEFRGVLKGQNAYGLRSLNQYQRRTVINNAGGLVKQLSDPVEVSLVETDGGYVTLSALYNLTEDGNDPATYFRYYVSTDGADPVPASDPATSVAIGDPDFLQGTGRRRMSVELGPTGIGTDLRVIVRMFRTSDGVETANTTANTLTTTLSTPNHPLDPFQWRGDARGEAIFEGYTEIETVVDSSNNVRWVQNAGTLDLYDDAALKMRFRYDSIKTANNGVWTTVAGKTESVSGASTGTMEVVSSTEWYWIVDLVRRAKFDLSANSWSVMPVLFRPDGTGIVTTGDAGPVVDLVGFLAFQVYDAQTEQYVTVAVLSAAGEFITKIPIRFRASAGDIP